MEKPLPEIKFSYFYEEAWKTFPFDEEQVIHRTVPINLPPGCSRDTLNDITFIFDEQEITVVYTYYVGKIPRWGSKLDCQKITVLENGAPFSTFGYSGYKQNDPTKTVNDYVNDPEIKDYFLRWAPK